MPSKIMNNYSIKEHARDNRRAVYAQLMNVLNTNASDKKIYPNTTTNTSRGIARVRVAWE